jgi:hypothetical protein
MIFRVDLRVVKLLRKPAFSTPKTRLFPCVGRGPRAGLSRCFSGLIFVRPGSAEIDVIFQVRAVRIPHLADYGPSFADSDLRSSQKCSGRLPPRSRIA